MIFSRDAAVQKKNLAEVDLARGRIEKMQVSSQLLEAVQQKVRLSQRLEECEMDLQGLLQEQVIEKLGKAKNCDKQSNKETVCRKKSTTNKVLSFFSKT